jgi:predicted XRE-type DNA-binding protein
MTKPPLPTTEQLLEGLRRPAYGGFRTSQAIKLRREIAQAIATWISREQLSKVEASKRFGIELHHASQLMGGSPSTVALTADALYKAWRRAGGSYRVEMKESGGRGIVYVAPPRDAPPLSTTTDALLAGLRKVKRGGVPGVWNGTKGAEPPSLKNSRPRRTRAPRHS